MKAIIKDFSALTQVPAEIKKTPHLITIESSTIVNNSIVEEPFHLYIVIDVSGSMLLENRLKNIKDTLLALIKYIRPNDKITILAFNTATVNLGTFGSNDSPEFERIISNLRADGETNIEDALITLTSTIIEDRAPIKKAAIFMTDGQATKGSKEQARFRNIITILNCEFISIGYGAGHDAPLLEYLSSEMNSSYYSIYNRTAVANTIGSIVGGIISTVAYTPIIYDKDNCEIHRAPNIISGRTYSFLTCWNIDCISYKETCTSSPINMPLEYLAATTDDIPYAIQEYIRSRMVEGKITTINAHLYKDLVQLLPDNPMANILREEIADLIAGHTEHTEQHRSFFRVQHGIATPRRHNNLIPTVITNDIQEQFSQRLVQTIDPLYYYHQPSIATINPDEDLDLDPVNEDKFD